MRKFLKYKILSIIIGLFLSLPAYQMFTKSFHVYELEGVTLKQELPEFSFKSWLNFDYQPKIHQYLLENYGFRPRFIRLYNQLMFSLFREYNSSVVTYAKEGYMYEPWFIEAYYGRDYVGDSLINSKVIKLQAINKALNQKNTKLMVVLTPSKAAYFPEYIPDDMKTEKKKTNYQEYRDRLTQYDIPFLDLNKWFIEAKDTTRFPLFTKTGTHWSVYGGTISLDTITRFMENTVNKKMTDISYTNIRETNNLTKQDWDIENIMNLIFPLDRTPTGLVDIVYSGDSTSYKPNVICISDSFYWILYNLPNKNKIYNDIKYWYYDREVYPDNFNKPTQAKDLNLTEVVNQTDVFMIMACPSTINKFAWGFIDRAYEELVLNKTNKENKPITNNMDKPKIEDIKNYILQDENWLKSIKIKAREKNISVDSMLTLDAIWVFENK